MAKPPDGEEARTVALAQELGSQLGRLKGAGPKITQLLSMVQLDRPPDSERPLGSLPDGVRAVPFGRVRRVIEQDLDDRVGRLFDDIDEEPFALASIGQVHRARTPDGELVAVKVQHPGVAEAVEADLRNIGFIGPILGRLAPELDTAGVLAEIRDRISDEIDYELEAQHQRRLERLLRGHPHVRLPRVHTDLSARRVLVTEYVDGLGADAIKQLDEAERDRIGEIAFRFFSGLAWRAGTVAGDPHPDNCIWCADGRLCVLDFGLVRDLDVDSVQGERDAMRAVAEGDADGVHATLAKLRYMPSAGTVDRDALLEHLAIAGEWMLAPGFRRVDPTYASRIVELGYPPRSPHFPAMRRLALPPATLLVRRMEVQLLSLLGDFNAGADWGAIAAEHHSGTPPSTAIGRAEEDFWERHARR